METIKRSHKLSEKNGVNGAGITSCEGVAPGMHGIPNPASAGLHQATDQTKEIMK